MFCSKCGKEFEGKFCPECGTPAQNASTTGNSAAEASKDVVSPYSGPEIKEPPKKKKSPKGCLIVVLVLVVLAIVFSFGSPKNGSGASSTSEGSDANSTVNSTVNSQVAEEKTEYGINDPATYENAKITVLSVEHSDGSQYDQPKAGNDYVIVTVQYENLGKDRISYNPYDFELQNSQGQIISMTFTTIDRDTALESGDLAEGGSVQGTIAFEAPAGDTGLKLNYTGNIFSDSEKIVFSLQ